MVTQGAVVNNTGNTAEVDRSPDRYFPLYSHARLLPETEAECRPMVVSV
jgi:hypothetical protein